MSMFPKVTFIPWYKEPFYYIATVLVGLASWKLVELIITLYEWMP